MFKDSAFKAYFERYFGRSLSVLTSKMLNLLKESALILKCCYLERPF